jgi:hypothetical protein
MPPILPPSATAGYRTCVYTDTMGHPTIGIGFNLDRGDAPALIASVRGSFLLARLFHSLTQHLLTPRALTLADAHWHSLTVFTPYTHSLSALYALVLVHAHHLTSPRLSLCFRSAPTMRACAPAARASPPRKSRRCSMAMWRMPRYSFKVALKNSRKHEIGVQATIAGSNKQLMTSHVTLKVTRRTLYLTARKSKNKNISMLSATRTLFSLLVSHILFSHTFP